MMRYVPMETRQLIKKDFDNFSQVSYERRRQTSSLPPSLPPSPPLCVW
jgi:hypothetical protein